jgi:hypothetical protein
LTQIRTLLPQNVFESPHDQNVSSNLEVLGLA